MRKSFTAAMLAGLMTPLCCQAELGGQATTTPAISKSIKAAVAVTEKQSSGYSIAETKPESGGSIKEYVNADGIVFAVTWKTPVLPNLPSLLGQQYFSAFKAEAASKPHAGRGPVRINQSDLVIFSGGRLRAFVGKAYVPSLLPVGFDINAIQ
ncbi:MAG TPA: DUF2844 domain-containing protein [Pseudomonadales bacterium]|nr:DUF2844 domain-containing protein [Pseudomonadales bacterium]